MKVKVKRFEKGLPMPEYKTAGAVGFDLYLRNNEIFLPHKLRVIPANLAVAAPKDQFLLVNSRGSTALRFGLLVIPGIIDQDFCGDGDEIHIQILNFTSEKVKVRKGTRIAQGIFVRISKPEFKEVARMRKESRGMLGTTGY